MDNAITRFVEAGEIRTAIVVGQEIDQRITLRLGHVLQPRGMAPADEQPFVAGLGIGADDGMLGLHIHSVHILEHHGGGHLEGIGRAAATFQRGAVDADDPMAPDNLATSRV